MAGVLNDYLVFPILDLIKSELQKHEYNYHINNVKPAAAKDESANPLTGLASTSLERNHPYDRSKTILTKVTWVYPSRWTVVCDLDYGNEPVKTAWSLKSVVMVASNPGGVAVTGYRINLVYDAKGMVLGTNVTRIIGSDDTYI